MSKEQYQYGYEAQGQVVSHQPGQQGTTVVITQQPGQYRRPPGREFSSGLCACFEDMESCCCVFFCGTCYICCMYTRYRESCCVPFLIPGASGMLLRVHHRARHNIQGSILNDCCAMTFCGMCTLCQLKRDMDFVENQEGQL